MIKYIIYAQYWFPLHITKGIFNYLYFCVCDSKGKRVCYPDATPCSHKQVSIEFKSRHSYKYLKYYTDTDTKSGIVLLHIGLTKWLEVKLKQTCLF